MNTSLETESHAWEIAEKLAEMPPKERLLQLKELQAAGRSGHEGWTEFLGELLGQIATNEPSVSGARAKRLVAIARGLGYGDEDGHQLVARFAALAPVQKDWSNWVTVADREELRLRLELIGSFKSVDDSLLPFLLFFFRASDPSLYQTAAISTGRLMPGSPNLAGQVASYAQERGLSLAAPIALAAQRVRRRTLLALAGACSTGAKTLPDGTALPLLPFQVQEDGGRLEELAHDAADLAVLLLALLTLMHSPDSRSHVMELAQRILTKVPDANPDLVTRRTAECWGKLFVACHAGSLGSDGMAASAQTWWRMLEREVQRQYADRTDNFAARAASFMRLDELCRSIALVDPALLKVVVERLPRELHPDDGAFVLYRVLAWLDRHGGPGEAYELVEAELTVKSSDGLPPFVREAWETLRYKRRPPSALLGNDGTRSLVLFFDLLLQRLESREHWLATDAMTRALVIFLLLDQAQHPELPTEQMNAILAKHGVVPRLKNTIEHAYRDGESGIDLGYRAEAATVLRVLVLEEQHDVEAFVDQRLLHQVQDLRVLLALLPSDRPSQLIPLLTDAFEHQLRWRLQRDPGFDPYLLLYTTTIRDPHPDFFEQLRTVMTNRTYRRSSGASEPVETWVETIASDVASIAKHLPLEGLPTPLSAFAQGLEEARAPLLSAVERIRTELRTITEHRGDIREGLQLFGKVVGGSPDNQPGGSDTLLAYLSLFHAPNQPLLQSGYHAWAEITLDGLRQQVQSLVNDMMHRATLLVPENWESGEGVHAAGHRIRSTLQAIESVLAPVLPQIEEALLREAVGQLQADLETWLEGIGALAAVWRSIFSEAETGSREQWDRLLTHTTEIWKPPARAEFIVRTWETLLQQPTATNLLQARQRRGGITSMFPFWPLLQSRVDGDQKADEWQTKVTLVEWALKTPVQSQWTPEEQRLWREATAETYRGLIDEAMNAKWEARSSHLLTSPMYRPLRRLQSSTAQLEAARIWCFDRYRLESARRVRHDLEAVRGQRAVSRPAEAWAFFLHYTPVWIGLMVGAFLMQDFGDAWTEMAREGDVRGIALTCIVGLGGAFAYMLVNLRAKVRPEPGYRQWNAWAMRLGRLGLFMVCSVIYTVAVTSFLWFLLSSTDEVVHGVGAIGHIAAWSGFALLVGTFFGLIAKA